MTINSALLTNAFAITFFAPLSLKQRSDGPVVDQQPVDIQRFLAGRVSGFEFHDSAFLAVITV
jgi:hypothetical protein